MTATTPTWDSWREALGRQIEGTPLGESLKEASLAGKLGDWTALLTQAVVSSCRDLGWDAAGKGFPTSRLPQKNHEYLSLDVVALPSESGSPSAWPMPLAVFELENSSRDDRVAYSLWKVLVARVPVRVAFAYREDWPASRELVEHLRSSVIAPMTPAEREAIGGETIVVVGNRGEGGTFPWGYFKAWRLDANLASFNKI